MKPTFQNLPEEKKSKIIDACIAEFGEFGYAKSSTDRIIKRAGISKGGLYEYISRKEELFLFIVDYTYRQLYGYLEQRIHEQGIALPEDILERVRLVSELAIDFYLDHPQYVYLIVKTYQLYDESLEKSTKTIFIEQFLHIFGDADFSRVQYDKDRVVDLIMWLLLKTRYDFLIELKYNKDPGEVKRNYLKNWDFYLSILRTGIYS